jgi:hypothetical protein
MLVHHSRPILSSLSHTAKPSQPSPTAQPEVRFSGIPHSWTTVPSAALLSALFLTAAPSMAQKPSASTPKQTATPVEQVTEPQKPAPAEVYDSLGRPVPLWKHEYRNRLSPKYDPVRIKEEIQHALALHGDKATSISEYFKINPSDESPSIRDQFSVPYALIPRLLTLNALMQHQNIDPSALELRRMTPKDFDNIKSTLGYNPFTTYKESYNAEILEKNPLFILTYKTKPIKDKQDQTLFGPQRVSFYFRSPLALQRKELEEMQASGQLSRVGEPQLSDLVATVRSLDPKKASTNFTLANTIRTGMLCRCEFSTVLPPIPESSRDEKQTPARTDYDRESDQPVSTNIDDPYEDPFFNAMFVSAFWGNPMEGSTPRDSDSGRPLYTYPNGLISRVRVKSITNETIAGYITRLLKSEKGLSALPQKLPVQLSPTTQAENGFFKNPTGLQLKGFDRRP